MELRDHLRILRRNWIILVVLTLLGGLSGFGYSLLQTPSYEASTQLYVSVRSQTSGVSELAQGTTFARQAVVSFVDVVDSAIVLDKVIDDLGLDTTSQKLAGSVEGSSTANSVIITIKVTNPDAELAAAIANSVGTNLSSVVVNNLEKPEGEAASLVKVETIAPATVPSSPSTPRVPINIAIGAAVGLILALGIAFLRAILDTRIHTQADVESATAAPVLGGIPFDAEAGKRPLVVRSDPRNPVAESFRSLRTNLQFVGIDGDSKSFVVTSPGPGEGKSTTATNLAIALAETGARVALVDADLRKPRIADYMGLEGGAGLADVLIGRLELTEALQPWGGNSLFVLASGPIPPNPSELLGSRSMQRTLATLSQTFDYVLIDTPPVLLVTDAAVVSRLAGGAIVVVAAEKTHKRQAAAAVEALNAVGSRIFGVVATMLAQNGPDSYGYGAYTYETEILAALDNADPGVRRSRRGKKSE